MDEQGFPQNDGRRPDEQETTRMPQYDTSYGTGYAGDQSGQYGTSGATPQYGGANDATQPLYVQPQYGASPYEVPQYGAPQYGAPVAAPPQGGQYGWTQPVPPQKWNGFAIAGFVVSFFISLVGLILSIIGLDQTKKRNEKGHGLAIAGIVISIVNMVIVLLMVIGFISVGITVVDHGLDVAATQSQSDGMGRSDDSDSQAGDDSVGDLSDELANDLSDDLADDLYDSTGDTPVDLYGSIQEFVNSPYVQNELGGLLDEGAEAGIAVTWYAEGDTFVIDYSVDDLYGAVASELAAMMDEGAADYQSAADGIGSICKTDGPAQVRVYLHTVSGQSIYDRTFVEGQ